MPSLKNIAVLGLASSATGFGFGSRKFGSDQNACEALARLFPEDVSFPNSTLYIQRNSDYYSLFQSQVKPRCFVTPRNTAGVSVVMKTLTSLDTPFTVKSGGHTIFTGSSIADGVTVDLIHLNEVVLGNTQKTVSLGPGNRWVDVSSKLDPLGLAVVGGRVADVGVGGLILGGGISFLSGQHGWACDNVQNYEVVLASGQVVQASPKKNSDLYWALRGGGGGGNFGIVTRFDINVFPQGDLWTQFLIFPGQLSQTVISLFLDFVQNGLDRDRNAHGWLPLSYVPEMGGFVAAPMTFHIDPPKTGIPEIFQGFQQVPHAFYNVTEHRNVSTAVRALEDTYGSKHSWWQTSIALDSPREFIDELVETWQRLVLRLVKQLQGQAIQPLIIFQAMPPQHILSMQRNGGNAMGLRPENGGILIVQFLNKWSGDDAIDDIIVDSLREMIGETERRAKLRGLYRHFKYFNYVHAEQDPLGGFGPASYDRLVRTAQKWDPQGKLNRLWQGHFKLKRDDVA